MADRAWRELTAALADDAESLAALHDHELAPEMYAVLKAVGFPDNLGLLPTGATTRAAWDFARRAVADLPSAPGREQLDEMAADYAAIYLTGAHGASPCESVWLDDDHLICQEPMFALRRLYAGKGLAAANWRLRPDDHLVVQLLFVAHSLRTEESETDIVGLAGMLDEHLLLWLPDFAARVASRAGQPFHAGLAALTAAWIDALRDLLAERLGAPRPSRTDLEARRLNHRPAAEPAPVAFMPGCGPSV